ncbi:MAG: hypothetical protein AAFN00_07355 [Cyanobacteria bacterium J06558_2]
MITRLTDRDSYDLNKADTVYCGRCRNCKSSYGLGLGNPFSHKNTKNCVWKVKNLSESLSYYHQWLSYLINNSHTQQNLADWEQIYRQEFLKFCHNIEQINTLVCFCVNTYHNTSNTSIYCHSQILWNFAVWYVRHNRPTDLQIS